METALKVLAMIVVVGLWLFVGKPIPWPENDMVRAGVNGAFGGMVIAIGYGLTFQKKKS